LTTTEITALMADLPLDQSRDVAALMLRLHADFRRRHSLPPLPTTWSLAEDMAQLRGRAALTDPALLQSPAAGLGPVLTAVRRLLWDVLKPLFFRQTEVNRDLILALEALARDREQNRHAHHVLSERVSELEALVDRLRPRGAYAGQVSAEDDSVGQSAREDDSGEKGPPERAVRSGGQGPPAKK
jgi:hypothetical protein